MALIVAAGCGGKVIVDGVADAGGGGAGGALSTTGTTTGHGTSTASTGSTGGVGGASLVCTDQTCVGMQVHTPCNCKAICNGVTVIAECNGVGDSATCTCTKAGVTVGTCTEFTMTCAITESCCAKFF